MRMTRMGLRWAAWGWITAAATAGAGVLHVSPAGVGNGATWAQAASLTNALALAQEQDELWLEEGIYTDSAPFLLATPNLALVGGFTNGMANRADRDWARYPVMLSGESARRVMTVTATNARLDGLTIAFGKLTASKTYGAGLYMATAGSLALDNCQFVSNSLASSDLNGAGAYFSGCTVALSNCVFRANWGTTGRDYGCGFYALNAFVSLADCLFTNNYNSSFSGRGAALYANGGSLSADRCEFLNNTAARGEGATVMGGGAAFLEGACSARFRDCRFRGNSGSHGGALFIGHASVAAMAERCLFADNAAPANLNTAYGGKGGTVYLADGLFAATNCTIVTNSATRQGGALFLSSALSRAAIGNSILWGNQAPEAGEIYRGAGQASLAYTCLSSVGGDALCGEVEMDRVFARDPLFAAPYTDLHLKSQAERWDPALTNWVQDAVHSPCIDAGAPGDAYAAEPGENGDRVNLGIFGNTAEASQTPESEMPGVENRGAAVTRTSAVLSGELTAGTPSTVLIFYGTEPANLQNQAVVALYPLQQTGSVFSAAVHDLAPAQLYYYACFATNAAGSDWADVGSFTTGEAGPGGGASILHVDSRATGAGNGRNWFDAFRTLAEGAAAASGGTTEIWVAEGVYREGGRLDFATNLSVYGGFAGTETSRDERSLSRVVTLDGMGLARVAAASGTNVLLDGLTLVNGNSGSHGSGLYKDTAGVLALANCTFASNTSVNADKNGLGAYFKGCTVSISNCVFRDHATAVQRPTGLGFYAENAAVTVQDSLFRDNRDTAFGGRGGGLAVKHGSLVAQRCRFLDNGTIGLEAVGRQGSGAVYIEGTCSPVFRKCEFRGNFGRSGTSRQPAPGAAVHAALTGANTVIVENCVFALNTNAVYGGAVYVASGDLALRNCTLAGNSAPFATGNGGAVFLGTTAGAVIENSILWANEATVADELYKGAGAVEVRYSCLSGVGDEALFGAMTLNEVGTNDPVFAVPFTDLHLKSEAGRWDPAVTNWVQDAVHSPCIDAGDPASAYEQELEGNGDRVNQGAYGNTGEASKTPLAVAPEVQRRGASVTYTSVTMSGELVAGTPSEIAFYYGTSPDNLQEQSVLALSQLQQTGVVFNASAHALAPDQLYYYACFASNAAGSDWSDTGTFETDGEGPGGGASVIHVDKTAPGAENGRNWHDAYRTIAEAAAAADDTANEIWIADGVYAAGGLTIATNASLYGGFAGWETNRSERSPTNEAVLDGAGLVRVVAITGTNVVLDGLTIANGYLTGTANHGAGICKTNAGVLAIVNCTIREHRLAGDTQFGGGGYFANCTVALTDCRIIGNQGAYARPSGMGIGAKDAVVVLQGCVLTNNQYTGNAFGGAGAAFCQVGGVLAATNCLFADNKLAFKEHLLYGGGAGYVGGNASASLRNCVFANNAAAAGNYGATPGGALALEVSGGGTVEVAACTFTANAAGGPGGALHVASGVLDLRNSILWANTASNGYEILLTNAASTGTVAYCDLTGSNAPQAVAVGGAALVWGNGLLAADPLFAGGADLHLKSKGGRWDPGSMGWVTDTQHSPAIDAGDPASDYANEQAPNGKRINLGAYGNTAEASKSLPGGGTLILVR